MSELLDTTVDLEEEEVEHIVDTRGVSYDDARRIVGSSFVAALARRHTVHREPILVPEPQGTQEEEPEHSETLYQDEEVQRPLQLELF